jgi:hypothetical protein
VLRDVGVRQQRLPIEAVLQHGRDVAIDLTRIAANQVGQELDRRSGNRCVTLEILGPAELIIDANGWARIPRSPAF